jgi:hypothetical protein
MDIVEKLRFCAIGKYDIDAAADEIERLREALKIFADNVKETNVGIDKYWAETVYALKTENQRLRETNKRLSEIATDAVEWLPPASVNGPREKYQNEIKELIEATGGE